MSVVTSDLPHAGTDSDVVLLIAGRDPSGGDASVEATLTNKSGKNLFERGQTDEFELDGPLLATLEGVTISVRPGAAAGWTGKRDWHLQARY